MRLLCEHSWRAIGLCFLLLGFSGPVEAEQWKQYSYQVPEGWDIVRDDRNEQRESLELEAKGWPIKIFLNLTAKPTEPDARYQKQPGMAGVSLGLPMALKLAGDSGEQAISQSFGSMPVGNGWAPSAWLSVNSPLTESAFHLHCFVRATSSSMSAGILMVEVPVGQVVESAEFEIKIQQAYGFFRSLRVVGED